MLTGDKHHEGTISAKHMGTRQDTLNRVFDQLAALVNGQYGPFDREFIDEYHHELDVMQSLGEDVTLFRIRDSDWEPDRFSPMLGGGGIGTFNHGPLRGDERMIVHRQQFERRFRPAIAFLKRLILEEQTRMDIQRKQPADILAERSEVLATLVDAYLRDQKEFRAMVTENGCRVFHPGLARDFAPKWSYLEALASAGRLILTPLKQNNWKINIPDNVLADLARGDPSAVTEQDSDKRVEKLAHGPVFHNYFYGGSQNVAQDSSDFSQTITQQVQPGNRKSLFAALRMIGLRDEDLDDLGEALDADEEESGGRAIGTRSLQWIGSITNKAITQGAVTGLVATMDDVPALVRQIQGFIQGYIG